MYHTTKEFKRMFVVTVRKAGFHFPLAFPITMRCIHGMQEVYKEYDKIVEQIHDAVPKLRQYDEFKFAMKVRDQNMPKAWRSTYYDELVMLPHVDDLPKGGALETIQDNVAGGISSIGDSMKKFFNRGKQNS
jgi:hypothetical protein